MFECCLITLDLEFKSEMSGPFRSTSVSRQGEREGRRNGSIPREKGDGETVGGKEEGREGGGNEGWRESAGKRGREKQRDKKGTRGDQKKEPGG